MSIDKTATQILNLAKKGFTIDLEEKIMKLRVEAIDLQKENLKLKEENIQLKQQLKRKEEFGFDGVVYWKKDDKKYPYCPNCYDVENKKVHLQNYHGGWKCKSCKEHFGDVSFDHYGTIRGI